MNWFYENWYKTTLILAILLLLLISFLYLNNNFSLFLIWLQTVVYLFHQFEEYIYPGGFVEFFNKNVLGSKEKEFPLDKKASFWINIPIIFIAFPLSAFLATFIDISFGVWTIYFSVINALSHVGMFFKLRYNPGLVASLFLNIPIGIFTIIYLNDKELVSTIVNFISFVIGLSIQVLLMIYGFLYLKPKIKNK